MTMTPEQIEEMDLRKPLAGLRFIAEAIDEMWGERCDDFDDSCPGCAAWKAFDDFTTQQAELDRLRAKGEKLAEALEPFSVYAGVLFAANFNRDDVVTQQVGEHGVPIGLLGEAFFAARAAISPTDAQEGQSDG